MCVLPPRDQRRHDGRQPCACRRATADAAQRVQRAGCDSVVGGGRAARTRARRPRRRSTLGERDLAARGADLHRVARRILAAEDLLRERVLDLLLDRALQRPRAVDRIEARRRDGLQRRVGHREPDLELREPRLQRLQLDLRDRRDLRFAERMEHDDLVDPVHELGPEAGLDLGQHRDLDQRLAVAGVGHLLDLVRAQVRRHHDHRVLEVDGAALAVGHPAVVQHLQQHVEHVGMRLLDLVQQDHAVRLAADRLGQVAALLVADVARRRADEPRDRMPLLELRHVDADQMLLRVEQEFGERLAQLGLADARRAEEQERAVGAVRIGQARARAPDRVRHQAHGLVLADDAPVQRILDVQQLVALALHHLRHRNAGRARDHLGDLLGADLRAQELRLRALRPWRASCRPS